MMRSEQVLERLYAYYGDDVVLSSEARKNEAWKVLISTILSARSRDKVTFKVADRLFERYGTVRELAGADVEDLKKIIRRIGFYNNKARNIVETARMLLGEYGGRVPETREELMKLKGVGRKTANIVLGVVFERDVIAVDTHVHRLSNRLGWVKTRRPEETEQELMRILPKKWWRKANYIFVVHGKNLCGRIPRCEICPVLRYCEFGKRRIFKPRNSTRL